MWFACRKSGAKRTRTRCAKLSATATPSPSARQTLAQLQEVFAPWSLASSCAICTHLSSGLGVLSYPRDGPHASWESEHQAQIDALTRTPAGCTVILGDLNASPAIDTLKAERPEAIATLARHGFVAPWAQPRCTWCKHNPMATGIPDRWLDHILFKDCPETRWRYMRVLDQRTPTLSDHYDARGALGDRTITSRDSKRPPA
jgi:hypothetical protein